MKRERGEDQVRSVLSRACVGSINLSEVLSKSIDPRADLSVIERERVRFFEFGIDDCLITAQLRGKTSSIGLSLGDRACLALAMRLKLPVLTADRIWTKLDLGVEVRLCR